MSVKGFDGLRKNLNQLSKNAANMEGTKSASLTEILTPEFMAQHTKYANAEEFFEASGFDVSNQESFESIPENELDAFVSSATSFGSWREMLNSAGVLWAQRKLGL
ncbi:MAG: hypothetical protein JJU31_12505 [Wenzhouxiangella sp.]|nr:hypothetical protein [Wenzhouxiangella sp.]